MGKLRLSEVVQHAQGHTAKKEQAINRAGIVQEDVQPPGLEVWSDPFGRK